MKLLKFDSIPLWAHYVPVLIILFLGILLLVSLDSGLYQSFGLDYRTLILGFLIINFLVILLWRRYWFDTGKFKKLVSSKGGELYDITRNFVLDEGIDEGLMEKIKLFPTERIQNHAKYMYRKSKSEIPLWAKIGGLFIYAQLGNPMFASHRWDWEENEYLDIMRGNSEFPGYMMDGSVVNVFSLGGYSNFASTKLTIYPKGNHKTGNSILDQAIGEALVTLKGKNEVLTLQIRNEWLKVKIRGGPWLGGKFGRRITEALEFTERLVELLSPHVTLYDPDKWTIDFIGYDYRVRQIEPSEQINAG